MPATAIQASSVDKHLTVDNDFEVQCLRAGYSVSDLDMYTAHIFGTCITASMRWHADDAAILHDYEHQGLNNDFLIKTRHELAIIYNDASPNENHHVAGAYRILSSDRKSQFAAHMTTEDRNIFRASVIELVLATDMKKHFGYVSRLQVSFDKLYDMVIQGVPSPRKWCLHFQLPQSLPALCHCSCMRHLDPCAAPRRLSGLQTQIRVFLEAGVSIYEYYHSMLWPEADLQVMRTPAIKLQCYPVRLQTLTRSSDPKSLSLAGEIPQSEETSVAISTQQKLLIAQVGACLTLSCGHACQAVFSWSFSAKGWRAAI